MAARCASVVSSSPLGCYTVRSLYAGWLGITLRLATMVGPLKGFGSRLLTWSGRYSSCILYHRSARHLTLLRSFRIKTYGHNPLAYLNRTPIAEDVHPIIYNLLGSPTSKEISQRKCYNSSSPTARTHMPIPISIFPQC